MRICTPKDCDGCIHRIERYGEEHCYMFETFHEGCMIYRKPGEKRKKTLVEQCPSLLPFAWQITEAIIKEDESFIQKFGNGT